jgi:hypothetical protein
LLVELLLPLDQTITDRICRSSLSPQPPIGKAKEVIFLLEKDFTDFLGVLSLVVKRDTSYYLPTV